MKTLILFICFMTIITAQTKNNKINEAISKGDFGKASELIDEIIFKGNLSEPEIYDLNFEKEKMLRIRKDFSKTIDDILEYVKKYYPDISEADIKDWENNGSLEYKIIDGKKYYFNRAHTNLFRINKEAKQRKIEVDGGAEDKLNEFLETARGRGLSS